jgi:hypothetical protein
MNFYIRKSTKKRDFVYENQENTKKARKYQKPRKPQKIFFCARAEIPKSEIKSQKYYFLCKIKYLKYKSPKIIKIINIIIKINLNYIFYFELLIFI